MDSNGEDGSGAGAGRSEIRLPWVKVGRYAGCSAATWTLSVSVCGQIDSKRLRLTNGLASGPKVAYTGSLACILRRRAASSHAFMDDIDNMIHVVIVVVIDIQACAMASRAAALGSHRTRRLCTSYASTRHAPARGMPLVSTLFVIVVIVIIDVVTAHCISMLVILILVVVHVMEMVVSERCGSMSINVIECFMVLATPLSLSTVSLIAFTAESNARGDLIGVGDQLEIVCGEIAALAIVVRGPQLAETRHVVPLCLWTGVKRCSVCKMERNFLTMRIDIGLGQATRPRWSSLCLCFSSTRICCPRLGRRTVHVSLRHRYAFVVSLSLSLFVPSLLLSLISLDLCLLSRIDRRRFVVAVLLLACSVLPNWARVRAQ